VNSVPDDQFLPGDSIIVFKGSYDIVASDWPFVESFEDDSFGMILGARSNMLSEQDFIVLVNQKLLYVQGYRMVRSNEHQS